MKKPNLLILGASGGVATVFLQYLVHHRDFFNKLILLSSKNRIKSNNHLEHEKLNYIYVEKRIDPYDKKDYREILRKYKIDIVLDLTDIDSIPLLEATNDFGASYINTSLNADNKTVVDLVFDIYPRKEKLNKATHILCAGMNPGIVNMWVRYGISKFGVPKEIIHFEYDTSKIQKPFKSKELTITWSPHEFLVENVRDPSGVALGRRKIKPMTPNAISHHEDMMPLLKPIMKLKKYPKGFIVLHEENLTLSYKYNIPSRFVYSIHDDVMGSMVKIYEKGGKISEENFTVIKNIESPLEGSDSIGVILDYGDKKVYYFNSINNASMIRTNATYFQVVIGIFAALFTLLFNKLKKGVYFTEDLFNTNYKDYVFDNMRVQEFIFKKKNGKLKLISYNPTISPTETFDFKHIHI